MNEPTAPIGDPLISRQRIEELITSSATLDFSKLVRLCEEINTCYSQGCFYAVIMLTRGLLDHVPPAFGVRSFTELANNYTGGQSIKKALLHLEGTGRNLADSHLHSQLRQSESLPVRQQVNFGPDLDVLLSEVLRVTRKKSATT